MYSLPCWVQKTADWLHATLQFSGRVSAQTDDNFHNLVACMSRRQKLTPSSERSLARIKIENLKLAFSDSQVWVQTQTDTFLSLLWRHTTTRRRARARQNSRFHASPVLDVGKDGGPQNQTNGQGTPAKFYGRIFAGSWHQGPAYFR